MKSSPWVALGLALAATGCVRAPEIVMVDRATALEQQAAGSFGELERKLDRAAIAPVPVSLSPEQLADLGIRPPLPPAPPDLTEADRVDRLLKHRCVGERRDGLLVPTFDSCLVAVERGQTTELVERVNRARARLWAWMHDERPEVPASTLQARWRVEHARGVICGGWMERDDGTWVAKPC